jgi:sigma-B regulation protein RsbU (phosphoserine phosphatase)
MEIKTIRILLIEDNPDDVFYVQMVLRKIDGTYFQLEPRETLAAGLLRLKEGDIDLVLLDLTLPDSVGLDTFRTVKSQCGGTPVIVLSGIDDETVAVNAVHAGAEDYMVKGRVDHQLLTRTIIYAIERNESRKALLKAEEKYRAIFENSVSGIFQTTPDGRYLNVNPALTRIYGYDTPEDLISGLTDIARRLYVDPNRRSEFIRHMQEEGVVQNFESQIYRKDGAIIWISESARAVRNAEGDILFYEGMVEDISARKEAEEKLRLSENRFRSVWDSTFDGMRLTDELGVIVAVNPSFCRTVGLKPDDLIGKPFHSIYSDARDHNELMARYLERFNNRRTEAQVERKVAFRTGKTVDLELSNSFIESSEGRILLLSVFRDITIRKQAEERERQANLELARSQAELRKKNEIMEEEINMAREIQQAMLPQQYPNFPPGVPPDQSLLRFSHRYLPTGQVGGDFFNVLPLSEKKAGLFICDVMGHGVRSALVTAMVRALVEELRPIALNPGLLLTRINSDLRAILQLAGTPLFTTAFYLVVDLNKREMLFANAGHPKPFYIHKDTGEIETLKNADGRSYPALGLFPDSTYPTNHHSIRAGDAVMLFTDGIYEVEGKDNQQFSQSMLVEVLRKHLNLDHCGELFDAILTDVQEFTATNSFADDVCLVGMEITENESAPTSV